MKLRVYCFDPSTSRGFKEEVTFPENSIIAGPEAIAPLRALYENALPELAVVGICEVSEVEGELY
jgi:hypothetical protein